MSVYDAIPLNTSLVAGSELNLTRDGEAMVAEDLTIAAHETHEFGFTVRVNGDVAENTVISNRATCGISTNALYPLDVDSNEVSILCAPRMYVWWLRLIRVMALLWVWVTKLPTR